MARFARSPVTDFPLGMRGVPGYYSLPTYRSRKGPWVCWTGCCRAWRANTGAPAGRRSSTRSSVCWSRGGTDGLAGLAKNFQSQGLGDIFSSWVSTGDNKPIQSDQLQNALGPEKLQQLTGQDDNLLHQALAALLAGPKTA
jgi:hypothetical protein